MGLAETAQLAVELRLGTTGSFAGATSQLGNVESAAMRSTGATGLLGRGFSAARSAASNFGGALSHAKGQLVGLLTGPLGMIGLGAGLFSLAGLFKSGISTARDFGGEVKKLAALTGLSYETTSKLAGAFDHFGISAEIATKVAGLFEKNLFALTQTTTKAGASSESLTKAQERLHVAELKLHELEGKRHVTQSQLVAAQNRVADATRALAALHAKEGATVSNASDFYRKYGLALVDASGKAKDFNTLLLDAADFWNNKSIPAQTKAAALAKLYGRSWQDLVPILGAGRAGIKAAEEEAARLGLTITKDNIDALSKAKEATRTWNDALGGLKLQIGLAVLPVLTDFTKGITTLVVGNRDRIVGFVKGIAQGAEQLATAFGTYVLPTFQSIASIVGTMFSSAGGISFSAVLQDSAHFAKDLGTALNAFVVPGIQAIVSAWDSLPGPLRTLLIEGFIANKIIKWTFGFDAAGFGLTLAKTFISNIAGKLTADVGGALAAVGIGKAFVQPVFVTNAGFGAGGLPGAAVGAAEGAAAGSASGIVAGLIRGAIPLIGVAAIELTMADVLGGWLRQQPWWNTNIGPLHIGGPSQSQQAHDQEAAITAAEKAPGALASGGMLAGLSGLSNIGSAIADKMLDSPLGKISSATITAGIHAALSGEFHAMTQALKTARKPEDVRKAVEEALRIVVGKGRGNVGSTADVLAALRKQLRDTHDPQLQSTLRTAIAKVESKLAGREWAQKELAKADQILRSHESAARKLRDIENVERALKDRGLPKAAAEIQARLDRAKAAIAAAALQAGNTTASAIRNKNLSVTVNTNVSVRDIYNGQKKISKIFATIS